MTQAKGRKAMLKLARETVGRNLTAAVPLLLIAAVWGCDTTAEIDFEEIRLASVKVLGYRASACGEASTNPLCDPVGCGQLDFVLLANSQDNRYLTPGRKIENLGVLTPGENFGQDTTDIEVDNAYLFELDAEGFDKTCAVAGDCSTGFDCRTLSASDLSTTSALAGEQLCVRSAELTPDASTLRYRANGEDPQPSNDQVFGLDKGGVSLVLALDNSGSIKGQDETGQISVDKATDNAHNALAAMRTFATEVSRSLGEDDVQFGVFQLRGDGPEGVTNMLESDPAIGATFAPPDGTPDSKIELMQNKVGGNTPVWESYFKAAEAFSSPEDNANSNWSRHVFSMLDSRADGSLQNIDADSTATRLNEEEVAAEATIVHFDSLAAGSTDPARSGPISDYDRLTCLTGGRYVYETNTEALKAHVQRLADGYSGQWSLQVQATVQGGGARQPLSLLDPGWYRLAATLQVRVGDITETVRLDKTEQSGGTFSGAYTVDTRLLYHVPEGN